MFWPLKHETELIALDDLPVQENLWNIPIRFSGMIHFIQLKYLIFYIIINAACSYFIHCDSFR